MTRVIEFIISLLIVVALFVVIALFLPSSRTVSHTIETNRPMNTVNDLLDSFVRFKDWNAIYGYDRNLRTEVSGPERGVGAKFSYSSLDGAVGAGTWELVEEVPGERIVYSLDTPGRGKDKTMTFTLERTGQRNQNVKITQRYSVDYGWDLIGRYAGLYVTRNVGDDIKRGLGKLSNLLATIPRFDYSRHNAEFEIVDVPAANVLFVRTAAKRSNDEIALAMTNQLKWMEQVMEKNDLERAGLLRVVTNEFTTDTYGFDMVLPVRRKGTGPDADEAGDEAEGEGEGEAAEAVAAAEPAAEAAPAPVATLESLEKLEVEIEGERNPVLYAQLPAIRAAKTTYVGPAPGLPYTRDVLRAWAMVHGHEPTDRPFEEYAVAIKDMVTEDAQFYVYWPLMVDGQAPVAPVIPGLDEAEAEAAAEAAGQSTEGEDAPEAEAEAEADAE